MALRMIKCKSAHRLLECKKASWHPITLSEKVIRKLFNSINNKTIPSTYITLQKAKYVIIYKYLIETSDKNNSIQCIRINEVSFFFHYSEYHYHKFVNTAKKAIKTFAGCFIGHETGPLERFQIWWGQAYVVGVPLGWNRLK